MTLRLPKRLKPVSPAHRRAPFQEKEVAKRIGGRTTKASGASYEKGDARRKGFVRVECKCTSNKSFSITREMIEKIENAALGSGEIPVIEIELLGPDGRPQHKVAVVPSWALESLHDAD